MKATIINSWLVSAEGGQAVGAAIWGLLQGRVLELLLWFIPAETTHFGVGFGRVEM